MIIAILRLNTLHNLASNQCIIDASNHWSTDYLVSSMSGDDYYRYSLSNDEPVSVGIYPYKSRIYPSKPLFFSGAFGAKSFNPDRYITHPIFILEIFYTGFLA